MTVAEAVELAERVLRNAERRRLELADREAVRGFNETWPPGGSVALPSDGGCT